MGGNFYCCGLSVLLSITLTLGALHKTHCGTNLVEPVKTVSQKWFSYGFFLSYQSFPPLLCQSDPPSLFLFLGPLFIEQWRQSGIP